MKKIEAIIRPEKMEAVRLALEESGYPGVTISEIQGHGTQRGTFQKWMGDTYKIEFLTKVKVEIVCADKDEDRILEVLLDAAATGGVGDGKIFVYEVAEAVRIRTRERGEKALA